MDGNLRKEIYGKVDLIEAYSKHMCAIDDEKELSQLYDTLCLYVTDLFRANCKRIYDDKN